MYHKLYETNNTVQHIFNLLLFASIKQKKGTSSVVAETADLKPVIFRFRNKRRTIRINCRMDALNDDVDVELIADGYVFPAYVP